MEVSRERLQNLCWALWWGVKEVNNASIPRVISSLGVLVSQRWPPVRLLPIPERSRVRGGKNVTGNPIRVLNNGGKVRVPNRIGSRVNVTEQVWVSAWNGLSPAWFRRIHTHLVDTRKVRRMKRYKGAHAPENTQAREWSKKWLTNNR